MAGFAKRKDIMLAYPAEPKRISAMPLIEGIRRFFHQPKLNGERGRTEWFVDGTPYLISSYGNAFQFIEHIQEELLVLEKELIRDVSFAAKFREGSIPFDGEVYVHGWSREDIDSALRRTKNRNAKSAELQYHIFDLQMPGTLQYERIRLLGLVEQAIERLGLKFLKIVPYGTCGEEDWLHHCACYCEDGYEGIILRNPFGQYVFKRSTDLLKFKPTETDTYTIAKVNEAISIEGEPKGMVGSFTVYSKDEPGSNVTFDVGAGKLKHHERVLYWNMRDQLPGKELLVKHELLRTTNQVPIAAVSVTVLGV